MIRAELSVLVLKNEMQIYITEQYGNITFLFTDAFFFTNIKIKLECQENTCVSRMNEERDYEI